MAFALYMIGFLVFTASLAWAAMVAGVSQLYIMIAAAGLLGLGIARAAKRTRARETRIGRD